MILEKKTYRAQLRLGKLKNYPRLGKTDLVEAAQEVRVLVVGHAAGGDVGQRVQDHHDKLPDGIHAVVPHKQDLPAVLVVDRVAEGVFAGGRSVRYKYYDLKQMIIFFTMCLDKNLT